MRKAISITMDEKMIEALKKKAEAENRTLSNLIEVLIKDKIDQK